ncbi:glycosyltransferase [Thioalkalicoccus limnaeus]|uniref:Glycosyltransferase n=1 Tax=Thioalkalicoccus limnaeus TaxID=120681 RepID=A0ABV4BEW9_9GAMM
MRLVTPWFGSFARQAFRAGMMEAQEILVGCAGAEPIDLVPDSSFAWKASVHHRLAHLPGFEALAKANVGLRAAELGGTCDVFIAVFPYWRDLHWINAIKRWRSRCGTAICWIDELWVREIPGVKHWFRWLDDFDHIFVGVPGSEHALSKALGRPCHLLVGAVDTLKFRPISNYAARGIDVYSVGRRVDAVHKELLRLEQEEGIFYVFDTLHSGESRMDDYSSHRQMYANLCKRSRVFIVAPGKVDQVRQTGGQADIGYRYFEGVAAGAVLVGSAPDADAFRSNFDWKDSIVEIRADGRNAYGVVRDLLADTGRLEAISVQNMVMALRRHDWAHRWLTMFERAGLPEPTGLVRRVARLEEAARAARVV